MGYPFVLTAYIKIYISQLPKEVIMRQYLDLLKKIQTEGIERDKERTGTGTKAIFSHQMEFNLNDGFPLLTTKRVYFRLILRELLWLVSGSRNLQPLVENNVHIWNEWPFQRYLEKSGLVDKYPTYSKEWEKLLKIFVDRIKNEPGFAKMYGDLGPVYGFLWRNWKGWGKHEVDQLMEVIGRIKERPEDRRHVITAWDPSTINDVALPPCHILFQFFVANGGLSCQMYQRSVDTFLGLPFNIASYSALTMMVAQVCGLTADRFIWVGGDIHIYSNHEDQVTEQLTRKPKPLPTLVLNPKIKEIDAFTEEDFDLVGYDPYPALQAEISV